MVEPSFDATSARSLDLDPDRRAGLGSVGVAQGDGYAQGEGEEAVVLWRCEFTTQGAEVGEADAASQVASYRDEIRFVARRPADWVDSSDADDTSLEEE